MDDSRCRVFSRFTQQNIDNQLLLLHLFICDSAMFVELNFKVKIELIKRRPLFQHN